MIHPRTDAYIRLFPYQGLGHQKCMGPNANSDFGFSVVVFLICSFFYTMLFVTNTWQDFIETGWIVFLMNTAVLVGYTTDNYLTYKKGK